jgi:hypothetical protein
MVGSQIIRSGDDNQLVGCARSDMCSPCSTEPRGLGPGVLLGRLAGRAAIRSKIGIGIGNGVFGTRVVSWAGWPRGTRTSRDGWRMWKGRSRLPQHLDYSFPQCDGLNRRCIVIRAEILNADSERLKLRRSMYLRNRDAVHRYPGRNT